MSVLFVYLMYDLSLKTLIPPAMFVILLSPLASYMLTQNGFNKITNMAMRAINNYLFIFESFDTSKF